MAQASELARTLIGEIALLENKIRGNQTVLENINEILDSLADSGLDVPNFPTDLRVAYLSKRYIHQGKMNEELQEKYDSMWDGILGKSDLDSDEDLDIE